MLSIYKGVKCLQITESLLVEIFLSVVLISVLLERQGNTIVWSVRSFSQRGESQFTWECRHQWVFCSQEKLNLDHGGQFLKGQKMSPWPDLQLSGSEAITGGAEQEIWWRKLPQHNKTIPERVSKFKLSFFWSLILTLEFF